jgi:glycosyltransferase involved in cell wall biosynthesis
MKKFSLFRSSGETARVAVNMRPRKGPWGGSSAFVSQFETALVRRNYSVHYDLNHEPDVIIVIDPRVGEQKPFATDEILAYKLAHPEVRIIQRVNECDQRKNTDFIDDMLAEVNQVVDHTVFISSWLRDYHAERWFDVSRSNSVTYNGADPNIFHPVGSNRYRPGEPFRLVTHHWSSNPLKGFDVYAEVDRAIAEGRLDNIELTVMGQWPKDIDWQSTRLVEPLSGHAMARELRRAHGYITASRFEPCGMHHVEGAQCGLPMLYHQDGGGIVEAGERYGLGFRDNVIDATREFVDDYTRQRQRVLMNMPSGDRMILDFLNLVQMQVCLKMEG